MKDKINKTGMLSLLRVICVLVSTSLFPNDTSALGKDDITPEQWRRDIDTLIVELESIHPNLYHRGTENEFKSAISDLLVDLSSIDTSVEVIVRLMQALALLNDGHTFIVSYNSSDFDSWFPLRTHNFMDGLFITVIDKEYAEFVGSQILSIGGVSTAEVVQRVGTVISADNQFVRDNFVPFFMSNGAVLKGLGIIDSPKVLPLRIITPDNDEKVIYIDAVVSAYDRFWFYRLHDGPPGGDYVTSFPDGDENLPLYLRNQFTIDYMYWFEHLREHKVLYLQFNSVSDSWEETFDHFTERLWSYYEENQATIDKFILDIRFNNGGNGYLLLPFIHEFIKHEEINQKGRLFTLVSKKTISAGAVTEALMRRHTNTLVVGEPAGGSFNFYSDPTIVTLPETGLTLWIPTVYHQAGEPGDSRYTSPDFPIVAYSGDYFEGRDPALEAVIDDDACSLADVLIEQGAEKFVEKYNELEELSETIPWWETFSERELERLAEQLFESDRQEDAITAVQLRTEKYPNSWRAWTHLGEVQHLMGNDSLAIVYLLKSLNLNPDGQSTQQLLEEISSSQE